MAEVENLKDRTEKQQDAFAFMSLVTMYQQVAWIALGKIANPATNEIERDLEQARWSIDVLAMLERRTRGNLTEAEGRMLRDILHNLRMNYVEEVNRPHEPKSGEAKSSPPDAPPTAGKEEGAPSKEAPAGDKPAEGDS